jgi:hypothetical protein
MAKNTKIIDLTQKTPARSLKPIEFKHLLNYARPVEYSSSVITSQATPSEYEVIELICRNYETGMDIMFAYNEGERKEGVMYFGKFNDGVVSQD